MKKALSQPSPIPSPGVTLVVIAIATILGITASSALLILAGFTQQPVTSVPDHHTIIAELQQLSMRLDQSEHRHRAGIDGVGQRLSELNAALGAVAEALAKEGGGSASGKTGGDEKTGVVEDEKNELQLKKGAGEAHERFEDVHYPGVSDSDEEPVLIE